jgi:hypothetical protein
VLPPWCAKVDRLAGIDLPVLDEAHQRLVAQARGTNKDGFGIAYKNCAEASDDRD